MEIKNKTIVVTGGASGLGEATARSFLKAGANVVIFDLNDDNANKIISELGSENIKYINTNVTDEESVTKAFDFVQKEFKKLHVVINCAGTGYGARIIGKDAPHPLDHFKFIIDLNLVGTFNVMRLGASMMDKNGEDENGVIINTASVAGYEGQIGQSAYSASKAGVIGLTLTAARDLARHSIRVNTIVPGGFYNNQNKKFVRKYCNKVLLNRMAKEKDIKGPVVFLASEASSYITGATLVVDGGFTII